MTVEIKLPIRLQISMIFLPIPVFKYLIGDKEKEGRSIFSLEIPGFVFGRIVDLVAKPKNHCPQQATKALIVNELRYPMKKVAFPMYYLREFG